LLGSSHGSIHFRYHSENLLRYDVIIIDEGSMMDLALFSKLLDAVGTETRLFILGDKDQLASVEAGSLFGDLCTAQEKLNVFSPEKRNFINQFFADKAFEIREEDEQEESHLLFEHIIELRYSRRFKDDEGIGRLSKAVIKNDLKTIQDFLKQP